MKIPQKPFQTAILAIAEIKSAIEDFDRGDANLFDILDRIHDAASAAVSAAGGLRKSA